MREGADWNIAVAGECMVTRPFSVHHEPEFTGLAELLRSADATYGHLEMNFDDAEAAGWPAMGNRKASYMLAPPALAAELRWLGIDLMSLAHNHSLDFGARTLLSTIRACQAAGLACAGTGRDLDAARAPAFLETAAGRVALVSASSGNHAHEWASHPKDSLRGRPGINPLRVRTEYRLDPEAARHLRAIGEQLGLSTKQASPDGASDGPGRAFAIPFPGGEPARDHGWFREADECGIVTRCHPGDLAANLRAVRTAAELADLVIVAHHFNISEGPRGDTPPAFVTEFARACVDTGADIFVGHGWHRTLGVEIYGGRPIFYGIGNFFAQSEYLSQVPYDAYEAFGHDVGALPGLTPADRPLHAGVDSPSLTWWSSAVASVSFRGGELDQILLSPVELGRRVGDGETVTRPTGAGPRPRTEGRPRLAGPEDGAVVLERLARLSGRLGTPVQIAGGTGTITP